MNHEKPLKILMLTSSYPRGKGDSAGIFLRHLAESLGRRGNQVHVLAPAEGKDGMYLEGNVIVHRFQYFLSGLQWLAYGSGILANLRAKPWLWTQVPFFLMALACATLRIVRRERPDLIHAHWILPQGLIATLAKYLFKTPIINTAHGSDAFALQGSLARSLKRFIVAKSDAWTSNSRVTANAIGRPPLLPEVRIIPMGIDVERFANGNRERLRQQLPDSNFLILSVGRLVEGKGAYDLLQVVSLLDLDLRSRTALWMIGEGEDRPCLERYAETLGISESVRFWGQISNDLLPDFYAAADLFVLPSRETTSGEAEGQGVVLLEAFAAGSCVIATRVGGIGETVEDTLTGMLVEPGRPEELASAIKNLLENPSLRAELAKNARAKVEKRYDWKNIAQEFEELYRSVI